MNGLLAMHYPYRDFQGVIDKALRKSDPDSSIPWGHARPRWAEALQPRLVADLGCATGEFTSAVITRLRQWGCLDHLEHLLLVEEEPAFDASRPNETRSLIRKRLERASGAFSRSLTLPDGIDAESIAARFVNGVLEVRIPKPEERKPRRVAIQVGDAQKAIEGQEA